MQTVIIRLVNNDRVIGQLIENSYDVTGLYAPMLIESDEDDLSESKSYYVYMPYDPLSSSCMVVFDNQHVLTVNPPKPVVEEYYKAAWVKYYPSFEEYKKTVMKELFMTDQETTAESSLTDDKLKDMFSSFMSGMDKKKLN